jgi:hypothetical protein
MGLFSFLFGESKRKTTNDNDRIVRIVSFSTVMQTAFIINEKLKSDWRKENSGWLYGYIFGFTDIAMQKIRPDLSTDDGEAFAIFHLVFMNVLGDTYGKTGLRFVLDNQATGHKAFDEGIEQGFSDGLSVFDSVKPSGMARFFNELA